MAILNLAEVWFIWQR